MIVSHLPKTKMYPPFGQQRLTPHLVPMPRSFPRHLAYALRTAGRIACTTYRLMTMICFGLNSDFIY